MPEYSDTFLDVLREKRSIVWKEVKKNLDKYTLLSPQPFPKKYQEEVNFHKDLVFEYPKRLGKYIRPTLVLLTAEAMGQKLASALKTAAAMQISEDWILNHDDFEDDSQERRGKPALHRIYGPALAVNAGDALHILMWRLLYDNFKVLGQELGGKVFEEFHQMLTRTALGQTIELEWTRQNRLNLTDYDWFFIADGKTSYYTIAGPMRLGAIVAGASKHELDLLYEFGMYLGRAFQIRDDVLDLTSDFSGLKKQTGNDIYEGKRTIPLIHLLRSASKPELKKIKKILAKPRNEKSSKEVLWIIELMRKYGSINYAQTLAEKLARKSIQFFDTKLSFLKYNPARKQLRNGIFFMAERKF
jgi:geranylgeranyl diphosphate synthase type II